MKNTKRLRTSLKKEVEDALNEQVRMEAEASSKYLAIASWCEQRGYLKSAEYFYTQSDEERVHMLRILRYINEVGGTATTPEVIFPRQDYDSLRECFEVSLESEIGVTLAINHLIDTCRHAHDYASEQLMLWFVNEQIEEEANARRALEIIELMEGESKYMLDQELGNIRSSAKTVMSLPPSTPSAE